MMRSEMPFEPNELDSFKPFIVKRTALPSIGSSLESGVSFKA